MKAKAEEVIMKTLDKSERRSRMVELSLDQLNAITGGISPRGSRALEKWICKAAKFIINYLRNKDKK